MPKIDNRNKISVPAGIATLFSILFSPVLLARIFFILLVSFLGYRLAPTPDPSEGRVPFIYLAVSFTLGILVVIFEYATNIISSKKILLAALGLLFGLFTGYYFSPIIPPQIADPEVSSAACQAVFGYFGVILVIKHAQRFELSNLRMLISGNQGPSHVLDTSAVIDGRVIDLINLKLLRGGIVVPQFVLIEMQTLADSADMQKRSKGRRGLEILEQIRKASPDMSIVSRDYPDLDDVDQKLVQLCKDTNGVLVTNDFNLEKVARVQQVLAININELANALRPTVFIGQYLRLDLTKEGKDAGQAIGHLDDGTMVVVDEGRGMIGEEVEVAVTSILQTAAGRMVFAKPRRGAAKIVKAGMPT